MNYRLPHLLLALSFISSSPASSAPAPTLLTHSPPGRTQASPSTSPNSSLGGMYTLVQALPQEEIDERFDDLADAAVYKYLSCLGVAAVAASAASPTGPFCLLTGGTGVAYCLSQYYQDYVNARTQYPTATRVTSFYRPLEPCSSEEPE